MRSLWVRTINNGGLPLSLEVLAVYRAGYNELVLYLILERFIKSCAHLHVQKVLCLHSSSNLSTNKLITVLVSNLSTQRHFTA